METIKTIAVAVILIAALIPLLFLIKRLVDWISFPCKFCHTKVTAFHHAPIADQENILEYFRKHEKRDPDKRGLFVCLNCRTVHDDFSGAKETRDLDFGGATAFCKVCAAKMHDCSPDNENIECPKCGTPYRWTEDRKSQLRFLMPPENAPLLGKFGGPGVASFLPFPLPRRTRSKLKADRER